MNSESPLSEPVAESDWASRFQLPASWALNAKYVHYLLRFSVPIIPQSNSSY